MVANRKLVFLTLFMLMAALAAYIIIVVIPSRILQHSYEGAKQIGEDINNLFQFTPEITVNNTVVVQQQTAVLELATLSQKFQHKFEWQNQWMGSTKKITITGMFDAKAGFDLQEKFEIIIDDDDATIKLPAPKLLSIEPIGDIKFEDEHGVWNWVNEEDRSRALTAFYQDARRFSSTAPFIQHSKTRVEEQLKNILSNHEKEVEFQYKQAIEPIAR